MKVLAKISTTSINNKNNLNYTPMLIAIVKYIEESAIMPWGNKCIRMGNKLIASKLINTRAAE